MDWKSMGTAPKDRPIVVVVDADKCSVPACGHKGNLCLYHAHAEGMAHTPSGLAVVEWGGAWEDSWEDGGGNLPDWWFRFGSQFEEAAMPIAWHPLSDFKKPSA